MSHNDQSLLGLASALPRKDLKLAKPTTEGSRLGIYDGKSTTIEQHPYLVRTGKMLTMTVASHVTTQRSHVKREFGATLCNVLMILTKPNYDSVAPSPLAPQENFKRLPIQNDI